MARNANYGWRYLRRGIVSHALVRSNDCVAVCGMSVFAAVGWYGTGNQTESETAAALPECKACTRITSTRGQRP